MRYLILIAIVVGLTSCEKDRYCSDCTTYQEQYITPPFAGDPEWVVQTQEDGKSFCGEEEEVDQFRTDEQETITTSQVGRIRTVCTKEKQ